MKGTTEIYRCELCGNIITKLHDSGQKVVCCGQEMTLKTANTVEAAKEKHIPVFMDENGMVKIQVGSVVHPMEPEHFIQFILATDGEVSIFKRLQAGEEPSMLLDVSKINKALEYCNLHGLWEGNK